MNEIIYTHTFEKLYKLKKRQPSYIKEEIDKALIELRNSGSPEKLGKKKEGKLVGCRAYQLSSKNRILYSVSRGGAGVTTIKLHKVCNHKQVYGQD